MRLTVTLVAVALAAHTAAADPDPQPDQKSVGTAYLWSIGATAAGAGLVYAGGIGRSDALQLGGFGVMLLGPTAGHWYAGRPATIGLGARVLGVGLLGFGFANSNFLCSFDEPPSCHDDRGAQAMMLVGGGLLLAGTVWDLATLPGAVGEYNDEHRLSIAPTAARDAHGDLAPGLVLGGSF